MSTVFTTAGKEALLQGIMDALPNDDSLDVWTGIFDGGGYFELQIADGTESATLAFSATAAAAASSGTATFNSITSDTNATGNASAITKASFYTAANVKIHEITAGIIADFSVDDDVIDAGDTVIATSLTATKP